MRFPVFVAFVTVPAGAEHASIPVLKKQIARLEANLGSVVADQPYAMDEDMCACTTSEGTEADVELLSEWVPKFCNGWGEESLCVGELKQDVKRVAPYHQSLEISGTSFSKVVIHGFNRQAASQMDEQRGTLGSFQRVLQALQKKEVVHGVTESELGDRIKQAEHFQASPDRAMSLRIFTKLKPEQQCHCFTVTQPRTMWDDAEDASPRNGEFLGPAQDLVLPDLILRSTLEHMVRLESKLDTPTLGRKLASPSESQMQEVMQEEDSALTGDPRFMAILDKAGAKYAKQQPALTWFFLLGFTSGGMDMDPCCDSGPLFPRYTIELPCGCNSPPCSNVYGQGFIFPWPLYGLLCYWRSCPYSSYQSNPEILASKVGNPSGRQWPERTVCSSHPSLSCNLDNQANNAFFVMYENKKKRRLAGAEQNEMLYDSEGDHHEVSTEDGVVSMLFAPAGNVYDARLVEALYAFAEQQVSVKQVTLFSTALQQFTLVGLNPQDSNYQHLGVTLEFSRPVLLQNISGQFLTLEMVGSGLMWQLTDKALSAGYNYRKKFSMTYDDLSPAVVARFIADSRGRVYKLGSTDCQTFAAELAQRLALHGRHLTATQPVVSTYLMHPASGHSFEDSLKDIFQGDAASMTVQFDSPVASCPEQISELRVMSEQAQRAWSQCKTPLVFTPATISVAVDDAQDLTNTIEVLRDIERSFYVSHPASSPAELLHGPTFSEYKADHDAQINAWFLVALVIGIALIVAVVTAIRALYTRSGLQDSAVWQSAKTPLAVTFWFTFLGGTPMVPAAAGIYWWKQRKPNAGTDEGAELVATQDVDEGEE